MGRIVLLWYRVRLRGQMQSNVLFCNQPSTYSSPQVFF